MNVVKAAKYLNHAPCGALNYFRRNEYETANLHTQHEEIQVVASR